MSAPPLLQVEDLTVHFRTRGGAATALDGLSFALEAGETLALVGASGSGKSTAALAVAGLLDPAAEIAGGSIRLRGRELRALDARGWQAVRRRELAMVFQQPRRALDPVRRIGDQLADALRVREGLRGAAARARAVELLAAMGLDDPEGRLRDRPHQLSGGQCQRVLVALALTGRPSLLLADEPTTALDPPTQAAVLALLAAQARARGMATLWITHDAALAAQWADRTAVLEGGRIAAPARPPAAGADAPAGGGAGARPPAAFSGAGGAAGAHAGGAEAPAGAPAPLLVVQGLRKRFGARTAVDGVDFRLAPGRALGLVGASGAGKSTIAALAVRLLDADGGAAWFAPPPDDGPAGAAAAGDGPGAAIDLLAVPAAAAHRAPWRRRVQMVPQDPLDSLDPAGRAFDAIALPLERLEGLRGAALAQRVHAAADLARLPRALLERRPHQLSGGQAARVAIARAIAARPALLVLDEPTGALDAAVRAEVVEMLAGLQRAAGMAFLLVTHDLRLVRRLCDAVAVLERGRIVEHGPVAQVFGRPAAEATRALLAAVPGGPG
ncbi:MAG: ATP-binding cassette domain-containing protein [Xylophilus ampelinus]